MKHPLSDAMILSAADLFTALGVPSRLRILRVLLESSKPLTQGAVAERADLSQANASKHLGFLVREGLVVREQSGTTALFSPVLPLVSELCDLVCGHVNRRERARYRALR